VKGERVVDEVLTNSIGEVCHLCGVLAGTN
jgi:hypothetical protein